MFELLKDAALFIALSILGWKALSAVKCPAPEILGSMLFVIIGNILGLNITLHPFLNLAVTIWIGMAVGLQFDVRMNPKLIKEVALVCSWLIITGLLVGRLLMLMGVNADTALFSSLPGALVEMSFISVSFNADSFMVTLFHASRMVTLLVVMPIIIRAMPPDSRPQPKQPEKPQKTHQSKFDWPVVIIISAVSGILLDRLQVPAGALLGPLVCTAIYVRVRKTQMRFAGSCRGVVDSLVGGVVGTRVTRDSLFALPGIVMPLVTLNVLMILSSLLLGYVLYRISSLSRVTAQLASVPGGLSPFIVLAGSMGADVSRVAVFHLCRYLTMIVFSIIQGLILSNLG